MKAAKIILPDLFLALIMLMVNGCEEDSGTGPEIYRMAPPASVQIEYDYDLYSGYSVMVDWKPSEDEKREDFLGYLAITYALDNAGHIITPAFDSIHVSKETHWTSVGFMDPEKKYKTWICSLGPNQTLSEKAESCSFQVPAGVTPPYYTTVGLDQTSSSIALIEWAGSSDENRDDFMGYSVATYETTYDGANLVLADSADVRKPEHKLTVENLEKGKYYRTYIYSTIENGEHSIAKKTNIYGAVLFKAGNVTYVSDSGHSLSGFGWNSEGNGTQYIYNADNSSFVDIYCRKSSGRVALYSPDGVGTPLPGARTTKLSIMGSYEWMSFPSFEPAQPYVVIKPGNVVAIKNQDNYYIKIMITSIDTVDSRISVSFDYKFQTVQGLRAAKK